MSSPHHSPHSFGGSMQPSSPYLGAADYLSVDNMRRARSDLGMSGGHRRAAKSEDFSPSSLDFSTGLLAPPASHPSLMVPGHGHDSFRDHRIMNGLTHHRRASSGSRAGSVSGGSSVRASPYPSPSTSPMMTYAQLAPDVNQVNMGGLNLSSMNGQQGGGGQVQTDLPVARPHVTTSATQAASQTRRTSEATFTCPVPGCGSTFTRHFNLKGEFLRAFLRSFKMLIVNYRSYAIA